MTARSGYAEALGGGRVHVGMRERLLELRDGGAKERRVPLERLLLDRDLVDPGHESESISGGLAASARRRSRPRSARRRRRPRADRAPELAADAHAPVRPAVARGDPLGADQGLHAGRGTQRGARGGSRSAASPISIASAGQDRGDPPARRQPEDRQEDGDDECYSGTIRTGVPIRTWSKSQVASEMSMRMQPCEAE